MPSRPPTACRRTGCGGMVVGGICSRCGVLRRATAAEHDERRGNFRQRGYHSGWDKMRDAHMAAEPLCRMCHRPATMVDHIIPIADGGELLDDANLQSLCDSCHGKKTAEDLRRRRG